MSVAYTRRTWKNRSDPTLDPSDLVDPQLNAANLNRIEQGIADVVADLSKNLDTVRTSDSASKVNNALADDDTLLFAAVVNGYYSIEAFLSFIAVNTAMDAKMGWHVPTGCVMKWGAASGAFGGFEPVAVGSSPSAILTASDVLSVGSINGEFGVALAGIAMLDATHAGNVILQWAQNTTDAGALKLGKGSFLRARRLA